MGESANGRCAVKNVFWTLVDLFCTKRLFLQETDFFPDYFTRDKNGKNSFSKEFSCSCAIYKFRFGTLCMILIIRQNTSRYGATICSYLLRMENNFLRKQANTSKEYHIIPGKYTNLYQNA